MVEAKGEAVMQDGDMLKEDTHILKEGLDALAAFLPEFESLDFEFGHMESRPGSLPFYTFSPVAHSFIETCYEMGWVRPFDWVEWKASPEAVGLRDDPSILEVATVEQLSKLLTVVIRQDRFVEGALGSAFDTGLLTAILRRAAALATE